MAAKADAGVSIKVGYSVCSSKISRPKLISNNSLEQGFF